MVSWYIFLPLFILVAVLVAKAVGFLKGRETLYNEENGPHSEPLVYLNTQMAIRPSILNHIPPYGYRLSCLLFGTGLIDRTKTLDHGFPYEVPDPIPQLENMQTDIATLCDRRAAYIVKKSRELNKPIRIFWSGGIDSTAACVALLKQVQDEPERLEIVHSSYSRREYKYFFKHHVRKHPRKLKISHVSTALLDNYLIVTGEHGDQLFGSVKALSIPMNYLQSPWQQVFPDMLRNTFATRERADCVLNYLTPQFDASPVPITNLFELLWWMNFSMKWQTVMYRMPASLYQDDFMQTMPRIHHFFQTKNFQLWSMINQDKKIGEDLLSYKWPLKKYILDFTGDNKYYEQKQKEPSLQNLTGAKRAGRAHAIDKDSHYFFQTQSESLKYSDGGSGSNSEGALWDDISDGE